MLYCTRNPSLKKPQYADGANITDINDNFDVIDAILAKCNFNGAVDPGVGDDVGDGYSEGSWWSNISTHKVYFAESVATGAALWHQMWPPKTADLSGTVSNSQLEISTGWIAAPALTYVSADAPNYVVTCSGDYSTVITPGMKMKMTQAAAIKYFVVVASSFTSSVTTLTLYGGTDYTLGATITLPYYSMFKSPSGFPLDPIKWTQTVYSDTATIQESPTTAYSNLGAVSLAIPIGAWNVSFCCPTLAMYTATSSFTIHAALSTSATSVSDDDLHASAYQGPLANQMMIFIRSKYLNLAAKTTYYIILKTDRVGGAGEYLYINGESTRIRIYAVCAYL